MAENEHPIEHVNSSEEPINTELLHEHDESLDKKNEMKEDIELMPVEATTEQTQSQEQSPVMIDPETGKPKYVSPILKTLLDSVKYRVTHKDLDWVAVVDGREGSGKSVFTHQIGKYLDPTLDISRITFNAEEFLDALQESKKFQTIILDEAYASINARAALTDTNKALIAAATEMRQKNLFVLICIPSIFDLDRYFAIWRANSLFHVYFDQQYNRGQALFFPFSQKKYLYLCGKKNYDYSKPRSCKPPIKFYNYYVVDEQAYRQKKADAFKQRVLSGSASHMQIHRDMIISYIFKKFYPNNFEKGFEDMDNFFKKLNLKFLAKNFVHQICSNYHGASQIKKVLNKTELDEVQNKINILMQEKKILESGGSLKEGRGRKSKEDANKYEKLVGGFYKPEENQASEGDKNDEENADND